MSNQSKATQKPNLKLALEQLRQLTGDQAHLAVGGKSTAWCEPDEDTN